MTEITANYDETWKEAIGDYFDSFLAFFYPEVYQQIDWTKTPISPGETHLIFFDKM